MSTAQVSKYKLGRGNGRHGPHVLKDHHAAIEAHNATVGFVPTGNQTQFSFLKSKPSTGENVLGPSSRPVVHALNRQMKEKLARGNRSPPINTATLEPVFLQEVASTIPRTTTSWQGVEVDPILHSADGQLTISWSPRTWPSWDSVLLSSISCSSKNKRKSERFIL